MNINNHLKIGFTGTQNGMTGAQKETLDDLLDRLGTAPFTFHHGDCIGADTEAHTICGAKPNCVKRWKYPANGNKRAFSPGGEDMQKPKPPLTRNRDIVNDSHVLIACPQGQREELRSGTWATIRYARRKKLRIYIIWPNGDLEIEMAQEVLD